MLGGTFNPPHVGHLVCAQEAFLQLDLDRVLVVPVHAPPHKTVDVEPGVEHRVAMCEAAVAGDPRLEVSRIEADRPGPSFSVDTLRQLRTQQPEDDLTFIVGGDMAHFMPRWREPEAVLELAELGVAEREELRREDILRSVAGLPGASGRMRFFAMPRIDVSSSLLRRRAAAGLPLRYLVPDAVAEYIECEGLYRDAATTAPRAHDEPGGEG